MTLPMPDFSSSLQAASNLAVRAAGRIRENGTVVRASEVVKDVEQSVSYLSKAENLAATRDRVLNAVQARASERAMQAVEFAGKELDRAVDATIQKAAGKLSAKLDDVRKVAKAILPSDNPLAKAITPSSALPNPVAALKPSSGKAFLLSIGTEDGRQAFRFEVGGPSFERLRRESQYNVAPQDRLTRRPAMQAVGKGGETISVSGAIYLARHGAGHIDRLRAIGYAMRPVLLTTGYGEYLGRWYIARIEDEQELFFADGAPRKQTYTLEFTRYGDDFANV